MTSTVQKRERGTSPKHASQHLFLQEYTRSRFNVAQACQATGISRQTFYQWKKHDPDFRELHDELVAMRNDLIESRLLSLVESGNVIATIYASKVWCGLSEDGPSASKEREELALSRDHIDKIVEMYRVSELPMIQYRKELEQERKQKEQAKLIKELQEEVSLYKAEYGDLDE